MTITFEDDPQENRFEVHADGRLAGVAEYRRTGSTIHFTHTEIDGDFAGRGLAKQLVVAALEAARGAGESVIPHCSYVRKVISESPADWLDLVPADRRAEFDLPT